MPSSRGSGVLFWLLKVLGNMVHTHLYKQNIHAHEPFKTLSNGIKQWGNLVSMHKGGNLPVTESALIGTVRTAFILGRFVCAVLEFSHCSLPQEGELGRDPGGKAGCSPCRSYLNHPCLVLGVFASVTPAG